MRRPDFFIVGAPKCGTTALAGYLQQHPRIFVSDPKEVHYFAEDFPRNRYVETLDEYLGLFRSANEDYLAAGEASVWYLYSEHALSRIHEFDPRARIVIMLRDPVDMIYSLHAENLFNYNEDVADFESALSLEEERRQGRSLPPDCRQPLMLQYRRLGRYSEWVRRVLTLFPAEQVLVVLLDDLRDSPGATYETVLGFLGVPSDGRSEFPRVNPSKVHRSAGLGRFLQHPPPVLRRAVVQLRRRTRLDLRKAAVYLRELNSRRAPREGLDPALRLELREDFAADVRRLAELIHRDLDGWLPA